MTRKTLVAVALLTLTRGLWAQAAPKPPQESASPEGQLVVVVHAWLEAEASNDHATLDRIFSDDFVGSTFNGTILGKLDVVPPSGDAHGRMSKTTLEQTSTRVFGSTGVVMGRAKADDPDQPGEFLFTAVLMNRGKGWQIVAVQLVHPPEKGSR